MGRLEKKFAVYDIATGLYVRKNSSYGGFRWVEAERATYWKNVGHLKNSVNQGVLSEVCKKKTLRVVELEVQTVVVNSKNYPLSEL